MTPTSPTRSDPSSPDWSERLAIAEAEQAASLALHAVGMSHAARLMAGAR